LRESFGVDLRVAPCIHEIGESDMKNVPLCVPVDAFLVACAEGKKIFSKCSASKRDARGKSDVGVFQ